MKYPMAGDLQRDATSRLTGNPTANPYEVRSSIGLEGTYANQDAAEEHARDLRKAGAKDVIVKKRDPRMFPPRPKGAPPMYHAPRGVPPGVPSKNPPPVRSLWRDVADDAKAYKTPEKDAEIKKIRDANVPYELLDGMARAIWVDVWATEYEEMSAARRKSHGYPASMSGRDYDDYAPETPAWAYEAAEKLCEQFEVENNVDNMLEIIKRAEDAERTRSRSAGHTSAIGFIPFDGGDENLLGHYLAMESMGHGVSWFDDHARFPLEFPDIDSHQYWDGKMPKVK